jgi:uncharacterized protein (DUF2147 family)
MKPRLFASILSIILVAVGATPTFATASPFGTWTRPSTGDQINFYDCSGELCAKIVTVKDPANVASVGVVIINGAQQTGDNQWQGDLFDPQAGKSFSGTISMEGADKLKLHGCVIAFLCSDEHWTRTQ